MANSICCSDGGALSNTCGDSQLRLELINNSHVEQNNYSNYGYGACISSVSGPQPVSCGYWDTSCPADWSCVLSLDSNFPNGDDGENAHISDCSANGYTRKMCCSYASVCINETGLCYGTIQAAVDAASAGQTVVITDARTYAESVSITKNITITSNGTSYPTVYALDATAFNIDSPPSGFATFRKLYVLVTGTAAEDGFDQRADHVYLTLEDVAITVNINNTASAAIEGDSSVSAINSLTLNRVNMTLTNGSGIDYPYGVSFINNTRITGHHGNNGFAVAVVGPSSSIENTVINVTGYYATNGLSTGTTSLAVRNVTVSAPNRGAHMTGTNNSTIYNSYFYGGGGSSGTAIRLEGNLTFENITIESGLSTCMDGRNNYQIGVTFTNVVSNCSTDISLWAASQIQNITVINSSTINLSSIDYNSCDAGICFATFKSYLDVYVNDTEGAAVSGATVSGTSVQSTEVFSTSTAASGYITRQNIVFANQTGNGTPINSRSTTYYDNHAITASALDYITNSTSVNMTTNQNVTLTLASATVYDTCSPPAGAHLIVTSSASLSCANVWLQLSRLTVAGNLTLVRTNLSTNLTVINTTGRFVSYNSSQSLWQNDNLTINGFYHLDNTTLHMNVTANGTFGINVSSNATLFLSNGSFIKNGSISANYWFNLNGLLNASDSSITNAGCNGCATDSISGSGAVDFRNITVIGGYKSLSLGGFGRSSWIRDSTFTEPSVVYGTQLDFADYDAVTFIGNTITSSWVGFGIASGNLVFSNNVIRGLVTLNYAGSVTANNNTLYATNDIGGLYAFGNGPHTFTNFTIYLLTSDAAAIINPAHTYDRFTVIGNGSLFREYSSPSSLANGRFTNSFVNATGNTVLWSGGAQYSSMTLENVTIVTNGTQTLFNLTNNLTNVNFTNVAITAASTNRNALVFNTTANVTFRNVNLTLVGQNATGFNFTTPTTLTFENVVVNFTDVGYRGFYTTGVTTNVRLNASTFVTNSTVPILVYFTGFSNNYINITNTLIRSSAATGYGLIMGGYVAGTNILVDNVNSTAPEGALAFVLDSVTNLVVNNSRTQNGYLSFDVYGTTSGITVYNMYVNSTNSGGIYFGVASGVWRDFTIVNSTIIGGTYSLWNTWGGSTSDLANLTVRNSSLPNGVAVEDDSNTTNWNFYDSTIGGTFYFNVNSSAQHTATLYNTTYAAIDQSNCDGTPVCNLTVINYLDVYVNDTDGAAVSSATVNVTNVTGSVVASVTTAGTGRITQQNITYLTVSDNAYTWMSNHTIAASKVTYTSNSTSLNMSTSQSVVLTLDVGKVCVLEQGYCWGTIQEAVNNATAGQTVIITDNKTYTGSVSLTRNITITSNGTSYPVVYALDVTAFNMDLPVGGFATFRKLYISAVGTAAEDGFDQRSDDAIITLEDVAITVNINNSASSAIEGDSTISTVNRLTLNRVNITLVNGSGALDYPYGSVITNNTFVAGYSGFNGFTFTVGSGTLTSIENTVINISGDLTADGISTSTSSLLVRNLTVLAPDRTAHLFGSNNSSIYGSYFYGAGGGGARPIRLEGNLTYENVTIESSTSTCMDIRSNFQATVTFVNVVSNCSTDIEFTGTSQLQNITIINSSTINLSGLNFGSCSEGYCFGNFKSYLDVYVNDTVGAAVSGATVNVTNAGGARVASITTAASGYISRQNITFANQTGNSTANSLRTTYHDNHAIVASKAGYTSNSTSVNMTSNQNVTLTIEAGKVCVLEQGYCWGTVQEAANNATAGQTVIITDNKTYSENITITSKALTITSNGSSYPTLRTTGGTILTLSGGSTYRVNVTRMNWLLEGNGSSLTGATVGSTSSIGLYDVAIIANMTNTSSSTRRVVVSGGGSHVLDRVNITSYASEILIATSGGANWTVNNSVFQGMTSDGMITGASIGAGTIIANTVFNKTAGYAISYGSSSNGILVDNITAYSSESSLTSVIDLSPHSIVRNSLINASAQAAIEFQRNTSIINSVLRGTEALQYSGAINVTGTIVIDTVLLGSTYQLTVDASGTGNAVRNITFLNTSLNLSAVNYNLFDANDTSYILLQNYLDVYVNDTTGAAISGATVNVTNVTSSTVASVATNGSGQIVRQNVSYYAHFKNTTVVLNTTMTNHTVTASKTGYTSNSTSVNMSTSQSVVLTLDVGKVCVLEQGYCWGTVQEAVDNATIGQTVIITDSKTYAENITINKALRLTSNGSSYPTLSSFNGSTISSSSTSLNLSRLSFATSGSNGVSAVQATTPGTVFNISDVAIQINMTDGTSIGHAINIGDGTVELNRVNVTSVNASYLLAYGGNWTINNSRFTGVGSGLVSTGSMQIIQVYNSFFNLTFGAVLSNTNMVGLLDNVTAISSWASGYAVATSNTRSFIIYNSNLSNAAANGYAIVLNNNTRIYNSTLYGESTSVWTYPGANNATIADSTLLSGSANKIFAQVSTQSLNLTIINSAISPSEITYLNCNLVSLCQATFQQYLDVYVNDTVGAAVSGATVNATSAVVGGSAFGDVLTAGSGYITRQNITYANQTNNGSSTFTTYRDNHTVTASKAGYTSNSTSVNMTTNQDVTLTITGLTCGELTSSATMAANLTVSGTSCFTITAPNVVLDCNGYTINGSDTAGTYGVHVRNTVNASIKNCRITDFGTAVFINGSNTSAAYNNTIRSNTQTSIALLSGNANTVTNNTLYEDGFGGSSSLVYLSASTNNTFANSTATNTGDGTVVVLRTTSLRNSFQNFSFVDLYPLVSVEDTSQNNSFDTVSTINGQPIYYYSRGNFNSANECPASGVIENVTASWLVLSDCDNIIVRNISMPASPTGLHLYSVSNTSIANVSMNSSQNDRDRLVLYLVSNSIFENITAADRISLTISENNVFRLVTGRTTFFSSGSTNNTFIDINMASTDYCTYVNYAGGSNNTIINSTCSQLGEPLALNSYYTNLTFTNVSFNQSRFSSYTYAGNLTVNWLLDVYVTSNGTPVSGASVTIQNVSGAVVASGTTEASGYIAQQTLKEYVRNASAFLDYQTPYMVNVTATGYQSQSTSVNLTSSRTVTFSLQGTVCVNETGICWGTVQLAVDNATSGQTIIITDGATYSENITITRNLTITSNGSSYPTITTSYPTADQTNNRTLDIVNLFAGSYVTFRKLNISASGNASNSYLIDSRSSSLRMTLEDVSLWVNVSDITLISGDSGSGGALSMNRVNVTFINATNSMSATNWNITINNSRFVGFLPGTAILGGRYTTIENTFVNMTESASGAGINTDSGLGTTIRNVTVYASSRGIHFEGVDSLIENSFFNASSTAIIYEGTGTVRNTTIQSTNNPCTETRYTGNATILIQDSVFTCSSVPFAFNAQTNGTVHNVTVLNSSGITPVTVSHSACTNSNCTLLFQKYLDVYVNDTTGAAVSGATVNATDVLGTRAFSTSTSSGYIVRQNVTYANQTYNGSTTFTTYRDNHTVLVYKAGSTSNSTSVNMSTNQNVTLTIDTGKVCVLEQGYCWGTVQEAVDNATTGQTVIITDNKTYAESVTISKNLIITSNGTGYPTIYGDDAYALLQSGGSLLTISRVNISGAGSSAFTLIGGSGGSRNLTVTNSLIWVNQSNSGAEVFYFNGWRVTLDGVNITSINTTNFFAYNGNWTVNNSRFEGVGTAFYSSGGMNAYVYNSFINTTDYAVDGVSNIWFDNVTSYSRVSSQRSVNLRNSFLNTAATTLISRNDTYVYGTVISGSYAYSVSSNAENVTFVDSILTGTSNTVNIDTPVGAVNLTFINTTVTPSSIDYAGCSSVSCIATFQQYLDVYVNDTVGAAVSGATVNATDVLGTRVFSTSTSSGYIVRQNVTYANQTSNGSNTFTTYRDNHTVTASKAGYASNSTSVNMTTNQNVTLTIAGLTCGELTTSATMAANLTVSGTSCFTITAPNVVLDCNGYTINGSDAVGTHGVHVRDVDNITVRNCIVSDFQRGIYVNQSSYGLYSNNTIISNGLNMHLDAAHNNTIENSNLSSAAAVGGVADGLNLDNSHDNEIHNNLFEMNRWDSVEFIDSYRNNFTGNAITRVPAYGAFFVTSIGDTSSSSSANNSIDETNTVNGNPIFWRTNGNLNPLLVCPSVVANDTYGAFLVYDCDDLVVTNVTVDGGSFATYQSDRLNVSSLFVSGDSRGVLQFESDNGSFNSVTLSIYTPEGDPAIDLFSVSRALFTNISSTGPIRLGQTDNSSIIDSSFNTGAEIPLQTTCDQGYDGNALINTTLITTGLVNFRTCVGAADLSIVNSSFNQTKNVTYRFSGSMAIVVDWFLDVYVELDGIAQSGVNVSITNVSGAVVFTGTTDGTGYIARQQLTEYVQNVSQAYPTNVTFATPYTVNVSYGAYPEQSRAVNLTYSRTESFNLAGTVCINETGICWPTVQLAVDNATSNQTIIITDASTYVENLTINKNLTVTSNGSGYPTIRGGNRTVIRLLDLYALNLSRVALIVDGTAGVYAFSMGTGAAGGVLTFENGSILVDNGAAALVYQGGGGAFTLTDVAMTFRNASLFFDGYVTNATSNSITMRRSDILGNVSMGPMPGELVASVYDALWNLSGSGAISAQAFVRNLTVISTQAAFSASNGSVIEDSSFTTLNASYYNAVSLGSFTVFRNSFVNDTISVYGGGVNIGANGLVIIDSIVTGSFGISNDPGTNVTHNVTIINSTITPSNTFIQDCDENDTCVVTYQSYLSVYVNNSTGSPVANASVNATSILGALAFDVITNESGNIVRQNVTYAYRNNQSVVYYDNHTIVANLTGVGSGRRSLNLSSSHDIFITLGLSAPNIPTLIAPGNNSSTLERYPTFNFTTTDNESDDITYHITFFSPAGCAALPVVQTAQTYYTSINRLCVDKYYNWTVAACDYSNCSANASEFTFIINSSIGVTFTRAAVDFGAMEPSTPGFDSSNSTYDDSPLPFRYNNSGNVDINISVRANAALWATQALGTTYFQYADNNTENWVPFTASYAPFSFNLTPGIERDLELNVTVPQGEPATAKNTSITILGASIE